MPGKQLLCFFHPHRSDPLRDAAVVELLGELISSCLPKMIADADAFISLHLTEDISIESIARELGYSKYYFSAAFKKSTGKTVNEYIRDGRLEYAKMQLLTSDERISQLSERLHFISPSYFTKCFKAYFGLTPNDLRSQSCT